MRKGAGLVALGAVVAVAAVDAAADVSRPQAGRYEGRTSTGGPAKLTVTARRTRVRSLSIRVLYRCAPNSGIVRETFTRTDPVRLRDGRFTVRSGHITVTGRFTSRTRARGTIAVERRLSANTVCRGEQTWTATRRR